MKLKFSAFEIDTNSYELSRSGNVVNVEPMVFDLIVFLASNPGQVFSRDALIENVWKGRIVSDATVSTCIKNVRKALGDTGENQTLVQTVRGRGYRLEANVEHTAEPSEARHSDASKHVNAPPAEDPSIMILPLHCTSANLEISRLATSVSDEIGRVISRIPLLRFSSEANHYKDMSPPPTARTVHEDFGVDFVLDGTLQESGTHARAIIQLSDAKTGIRIWSHAFTLEQPFYSNIDTLTGSIIARLEPQIHRAMYTLVRSRSDAPDARQLFLEASGLLVVHGWSHDSFDKAAALLDKSAALDPDFALTPALQALLHGFSSRIGLSIDQDKATATAREMAERALALDSMDSTVVGLAGCSLADIGDIDRGEALLKNAIELNESNAQAWVALGAVQLSKLDIKEAVQHLSKGMDISPHDSRLSIWGAFLAIAQLMNRESEAACETAEIACRRHDKTYLPRIALAATRLVTDNEDGARLALKDAYRIKPDLSRKQISALIGHDLCTQLLSL